MLPVKKNRPRRAGFGYIVLRVLVFRPEIIPVLERLLDRCLPEMDAPLTQIIDENLLPIGLISLLALLSLATWLYLRKRKVLDHDETPAPPVDPYAEALENIDALQKSKPRLQPKPFVFRLSEILRVYVEKLFKVPAMELTSEEFMREIVSHSFFKNRYEDLLREFVNRGDRVKYSTQSMDQEEMNVLLDSALHFVKDTHLKLQEERDPSGSLDASGGPR